MKIRSSLIILITAAAFVLAACSNNSSSQTTVPSPSPAAASEATPSVTPVPSQSPVAEPRPTESPAATPEPTPAATPEPTPAPAPAVTEDMLTIMTSYTMYTYDQLAADAELLVQLYPGLVTKDVIGKTADGRDLIHFIAGNPQAEKQIFINGAIHGREYITAQLVMKQLAVYLKHVSSGDYYGETGYKDMWNNVAVHVVPMVNPDGASISQLGLDAIRDPDVLSQVYSVAANDGSDLSVYYTDHWKANASGVDLNRNFDAYWEYYEGTALPSADHYKGEYPGSEPEAAALIDLTLNNNFLYTISYHAQGSLIYWCFDNMEPIYDISLDWVSQLSAATGYYLNSNYSSVDPAGYSDWGIYRCQIPSVTIEVAYGECPYLQDQFERIWQENLSVWEITILSAMAR